MWCPAITILLGSAAPAVAQAWIEPGFSRGGFAVNKRSIFR
jgi:hypothetical protein